MPLVVVTGSIAGHFVAMSIPNMLVPYDLPDQYRLPTSRVVRRELKYALLGGGIVGSLSTIPVFVVLGIVAGVVKLVQRLVAVLATR